VHALDPAEWNVWQAMPADALAELFWPGALAGCTPVQHSPPPTTSHPSPFALSSNFPEA